MTSTLLSKLQCLIQLQHLQFFHPLGGLPTERLHRPVAIRRVTSPGQKVEGPFHFLSGSQAASSAYPAGVTGVYPPLLASDTPLPSWEGSLPVRLDKRPHFDKNLDRGHKGEHRISATASRHRNLPLLQHGAATTKKSCNLST